jgi:hypothetical protein
MPQRRGAPSQNYIIFYDFHGSGANARSMPVSLEHYYPIVRLQWDCAACRLTSSTDPGAWPFSGAPAPSRQDRAWDPVSSASVSRPKVRPEPLRGNNPPDPARQHTYGPETRCILRRREPGKAKERGSGSSRALHRSFPFRENAGYAVPCISYHEMCGGRI